MLDETIFMKKYPISLNDAILFPLIYKTFFNQKKRNLPDPNQSHMIDFAGFAGFSEGAIRTALTRLKKKGSIISYKKDGKIYYKMSEIRKKVSNYYINTDKKKEFTIVIFSFNRENSGERYQIRKILKKIGFKMLAQNAYINIRIKKDDLLYKIKGAGFEKNLYIFDSIENLEPFVARNVLKAWKVDEYIKKLNSFYVDFKNFISFMNKNTENIFNLLGYAGVVVFSYFQRNDPPIADIYLPDDYPLKKINAELIEMNIKFSKTMKAYYLKLAE